MVNVHFYEKAEYILTGSNSDTCGELRLGFCALDDAIEKAEQWIEEYCFDSAMLLNAVTGEVICDITPEEEEDDYSRYGDCDDWDIEMGFDPYEGCYTYDC